MTKLSPEEEHMRQLRQKAWDEAKEHRERRAVAYAAEQKEQQKREERLYEELLAAGRLRITDARIDYLYEILEAIASGESPQEWHRQYFHLAYEFNISPRVLDLRLGLRGLLEAHRTAVGARIPEENYEALEAEQMHWRVFDTLWNDRPVAPMVLRQRLTAEISRVKEARKQQRLQMRMLRTSVKELGAALANTAKTPGKILAEVTLRFPGAPEQHFEIRSETDAVAIFELLKALT